MLFFIVFLISIIALYKSSELIIKYSIKLSRILGISTFAVGFILLALSTSLPELFVAIIASLKGEVGLAVGTILGSNLADLTLVLGGTALIGTIYLKKRELLELVELLFITLLIMIFIFFRGAIEPVHGYVLLIIFALLLSKLYRKGQVKIIDKEKKGENRKKLYPTLFKFFISIIILLASTKYLVESAIEMAVFFGIASSVIGATLVALGTSLPEVSVNIRAIKEKQYSLALGNIFGSTLTNLTLVLGTIAIFTPTAINIIPLFDLLPFLLISTLTVWYLLSRKNKITKENGFVLVMIYFLFLAEKIGITIFF